MKVSKDGVTFHEIETDYDPQTGVDRSMQAAVAKGYKPYIDVSKDGKQKYTIEASGDSLKAATDKGYKPLEQFQSDAAAENQFRSDVANENKDMSASDARARSAVSGLLGGFSDEAQGLVGSAKGLLQGDTSVVSNYKATRDAARAVEKVGEAKYPVQTSIANVVGSIVSPINKIIPGSGIMQAARIGAVNAAGVSEADSPGDLAKDTAQGGAIGFGTGALIGGVSKLIQNRGNIGKKALQVVTDTSPEMSDKLLSKAPTAIKNARTREELGDAAIDAVSALRSKVSQGSSDAFDILARENVQIPKQTFLDAIDNQVTRLKSNGVFTAEAERDIARLDGIRSRIDKVNSDSLSGVQGKAFMQQLDNSAQEATSAGGFVSSDVKAMRNIRKDIDIPLKEMSPAYKEKMAQVAQDVDVLERANKLFGKEQTVTSRLDNINRKNVNPYIKSTLNDLDRVGGTSLGDEIENAGIRDYFAKDTTNGARKTVAGTVIGSAVGTALGPFGSAIGAAVGGAAGAALDKNARPVAEAALRLSQKLDPIIVSLGKYAQPLADAAKKGPAQFLLVHSLLLKDPKYKAQVEARQ